jgi:prepilin-type N-terminal cleavage/methylation domain-containing protein
MKQLRVENRRLPLRSAGAGFTLIELLAVMAIILILAGLILYVAGNANYNAAKSRAQTEVQAISTACEAYKTDNGVYPRVTMAASSSQNTDGLNPRLSFDPAATSGGGPSYSTTSMLLYQILCGQYYMVNGVPTIAPSTLTPQPTTYYTFTDSQLANSGAITSGYIPPTTVTAINDPFGYSYGYSTAYQYNVEQNAASGATTPPTEGYNPTFDLWSTAAYSPTAGKSYPTNVTQANYNNLWVKNW